MPTVVIHTLPINYARYVRSYAEGANLLTSSTRRTPPECLDPRAKITNKMNHILAELEVKAVDKDAIPLMLGTDGTVAEASWANVFFVQGGDIYTPQPKNILLGIMRENVLEVAAKAGIRITEGTYFPYDLSLADEIFLSSTACCVLPVGRFNGRKLAAAPGPVTKALMAAWVDEVGLDFVAQARSLAKA